MIGQDSGEPLVLVERMILLDRAVYAGAWRRRLNAEWAPRTGRPWSLGRPAGPRSKAMLHLTDIDGLGPLIEEQGRYARPPYQLTELGKMVYEGVTFARLAAEMGVRPVLSR
jgi:hypothetical protein